MKWPAHSILGERLCLGQQLHCGGHLGCSRRSWSSSWLEYRWMGNKHSQANWCSCTHHSSVASAAGCPQHGWLHPQHCSWGLHQCMSYGKFLLSHGERQIQRSQQPTRQGRPGIETWRTISASMGSLGRWQSIRKGRRRWWQSQCRLVRRERWWSYQRSERCTAQALTSPILQLPVGWLQ